MPITRELKPRPVLFLLDHPVVKEEESGNSYSEYCSTTLKQALLGAAASFNKNSNDKFHLGVNEVCYTYLSSSRPVTGDSDWKTSIVNKKNIPAGETYHQCEWLKDVWVSPKVWKAIQETIAQIKAVQPKLIICAGKWSFLFFATFSANPTEQLATIAGTKTTFKRQIYFGGLNKFRASLLTTHSFFELPPTVLIPIYNPQSHWVIRDKVEIIKRDYTRVAKIYRRLCLGETVEDILTNRRKYLIGTELVTVKAWLLNLFIKLEKEPTKVVFDVETRQQGIDCIGVGYEAGEALTIPFTELYYEEVTEAGVFAYTHKTEDKKKQEVYLEMPVGSKVIKYRHFWSIEDEVDIMFLLQKVMLHPNCQHVGQNYLYDCQFYYRQWKLKIDAYADTMIQHHVLYNYLQKDLALLASMYVGDFVYWKDEIDSRDNHTRWNYNAKDICYTKSIESILSQMLKAYDPKLQEFYQFQQHHVCKSVVTMMNRGVKIDKSLKEEMNNTFSDLMDGCLEKLRWVANESEFNPNSTPQVKNFFKTLLGIKPLVNRKTKAESFGADAMLVYLEEYPEYRALLTLFLEYKSIKVFVRTFLSMKLSYDERLRCSYNPAGTKTYRFSSRKDVDGNGGNLANIPSKGKIDLRYALQEIYTGEETDDSYNDVVPDGVDINTPYEGKLVLPNCKKMFIPDNGWVFFDADYSAIDLHFVVWESDCKFLKDIIKAGKDVYSVLASHYYEREITKKDDERQIFKSVCHGANYLGRAPTLAAKAGLSVPQVKKVLDWYFSMCPEIPAWHKRIDNDVRTKQYTSNVFGARFWCLDFTDPMYLNKVVAAVPQSSAGILVNKALCKLEETEKGQIQILLQTHDSLSGQFRQEDTTAVERIRKYMELTIPYKDPLVIPAQIKTSTASYGDCH
jgi:DNA polymerase I - 3''-5'' exonuclease and polymerase domains